jgi:hypothetical protein
MEHGSSRQAIRTQRFNPSVKLANLSRTQPNGTTKLQVCNSASGRKAKTQHTRSLAFTQLTPLSLKFSHTSVHSRPVMVVAAAAAG